MNADSEQAVWSWWDFCFKWTRTFILYRIGSVHEVWKLWIMHSLCIFWDKQSCPALNLQMHTKYMHLNRHFAHPRSYFQILCIMSADSHFCILLTTCADFLQTQECRPKNCHKVRRCTLNHDTECMHNNDMKCRRFQIFLHTIEFKLVLGCKCFGAR